MSGNNLCIPSRVYSLQAVLAWLREGEKKPYLMEVCDGE